MKFLRRWFGDDSADRREQRNEEERTRVEATEGLSLLRSVVEADPENADAHQGLGMIALRRFAADPNVALLSEAVQHLGRAVALRPDSAEALLYLAFAESFTLETIDQAEQHLAQAITLDAGIEARANEIRDRIAAARGRLREQAVDQATLQAAVAASEQGHARLQAGQPGESIALFEQAIELYPAYVEALIGLGDAYRALDRTDEALRAFRRALAIRPHMLEAHLGAGSLYVRRGEHDRALDHLLVALEQSPEQPNLLRTVGLVQLAASRPADAAATFRRLCAKTPDDPEPRLQLAIAAAQSGDAGAARDALDRLRTMQLTAPQQELATRVASQIGADDPAADQRRAGES